MSNNPEEVEFDNFLGILGEPFDENQLVTPLYRDSWPPKTAGMQLKIRSKRKFRHNDDVYTL